MGLVGLVLMIGVLNLALGYALAVHLGFGSWNALTSRPPLPRPREQTPPAAAAKSPPPTSDVQSSLSELLGEKEPPVDTATIADMLDDDPPDSGQLDPCYEPYDDDVAELLSLDQPEAWNLNEKYVETSILKLNIAMIKSGQQAVDLNTRLRAIREEPDLETIQQCRERLLDDCQVYLVEQSQAAEKFSNRISELGELKSLGEDIEMANLEQAAQVETTISNLQFLDLQSDLHAAGQRLLTELNNLRAARHKLRDDQEMAFMTIARYEDRVDAIEKRLHNDPLTGLRNRIGLESTLWQWWKQKRHHDRQMSAALFDLDHFGKLNEEFGFAASDRILVEVSALIQQRINSGDLLGRLSGQQFLAVFTNVGPRAAVKTAELIRQTIDKADFLQNGARIPVTVSCGIIEVVPDNTHEAFFHRLEATLKHAKKAAGNHASFHNGEKPDSVESPNLAVEQQEIQIP